VDCHRHRTELYVWATDEGPPVKQILRRESYRFVAEVAGAKVYDDGTRTF
jgi:hypothetical protein